MKGPTPSALQREDGLWLPTLGDDAMANVFQTEEAATYAARRRVHAWWHRSDALATASVSMTTCEECNDKGEPA